ncbi:unnamed protein product [Prorocentrum cordatum]|uniref:Peptidase M28 domain-containing protein n=1 Tax=Prorocentrum cordatum TaxID=2364126 RepID=A0ABN9SV41_9DINO|nr:unnamed protein product [Polarella glacialis]
MERSAVESISADSYLELLQRIVNIKDDLGFTTRSYADLGASHAAQAFVVKEFESMGLKSCLQKFTYQGNYPMANVIAVIPGTGEGTLTVGAHYDSRPFKGTAPGAEDNGSGLAAMLSVARAFAKAGVKPKRTIYFVGFAGEEPGLVGSDVFARELKAGNPLPAECGAAGASSSFLQTPRKWKEDSGHEAIALDEVGWLTPKDTIENVTPEYANKISKMVMGALVQLARNPGRHTAAGHPGLGPGVPLASSAGSGHAIASQRATLEAVRWITGVKA